jgi:hypothetical protein
VLELTGLAWDVRRPTEAHKAAKRETPGGGGGGGDLKA